MKNYHQAYAQKQRRLRALSNQVPKLNNRLDRLRATSNRYTTARLALFIAGGVAAAALFLSLGPAAAIAATVIFAAIFVAVVYCHNQVEQAIARYEIWLAIKRAQIARIERDWANLPETLPVPPRLDHSFATDLDLIGPRSLHHLLDTTTSREASERLRQWLLDNNPDLDLIGRRQALVAELADMARYRDRLALYATLTTTSSGEKWSAQPLLKWLDAPEDSQSMRLTSFATTETGDNPALGRQFPAESAGTPDSKRSRALGPVLRLPPGATKTGAGPATAAMDGCLV
jgi:hypothetical protein